MTFLQFVFLALFLFIALAIWYFREVAKHQKKSKLIFASLPDFTATEQYLSQIGAASIAYDGTRKKVCILAQNHQPNIYDFKDILECELLVDGTTILKQSNVLGRSIVGAVIGGGVGAVVGGLTGSKKQDDIIKKIDLKISVNDLKTPFHKINFLSVESKKGSFTYNTTYEDAERWHGIISTIIRQSNEK